MNEVATGKATRVECLLFDEEDGLTAGETATGAQPAACRTPDGRLWFATPQGLALIDPATVVVHRPAPKVILETLRTAERAYPLLDAPASSPVSRLPSLSLPPGSGHTLAVEFTALEYSAPRRLRFRYRLAGHDAGWIESGVRRTAFYTNLKPRDYRFQVQAVGRDGRWTEPGETLAFAIVPFLHETTAFKFTLGLLIALTATGSGWGVYRWRRGYLERIHQLEREQAVATERKRIARDLHDQIGSELTRLSFASEASASGGGEVPGLARDAVRSLEEVVWATDPAKDDVLHLVEFLSRHTREYLAGQPIRLHLEVPIGLPASPLTAHVRHHLALAFKEALHNVVKHAAASEVRLKVSLQPAAGRADFPVRPRAPQARAVPSSSPETTPRTGPGTGSRDRKSALPELEDLVIELADDGCGFDASQLSQNGNGLGNMISRLSEAGGTCRITSSPGRGTTVCFTLPVAPPSSGTST